MALNTATMMISGLSLLISFLVAFGGFWRSRATVKITQPVEDRSWILKSYDGSMAAVKQKSKNPTIESVALIEVILTNNSSLPISILEFEMEGAKPFNSYSYLNQTYRVTPKHGAPSDFSSSEDPLMYLKPEFTLDPYTSVRGHLHFWMDGKESIQSGTHDVVIITSRKKIRQKVQVNKTYESKIQAVHTAL